LPCPIEAAEKVRRDFMRSAKCGLAGSGSRSRAAAPVSGSTAQVHDLLAGAPGEKAGLEKGDVLCSSATSDHFAGDVRDARFSSPRVTHCR
jgi:hypothetical protein